MISVPECDLGDPFEHSGPHLKECRYSPESWNDPSNWPNHEVSWNAPLCEYCWYEIEPNRLPVRVIHSEPKVCSNCGDAHRTGIYRRIAPTNQIYKNWVERE